MREGRAPRVRQVFLDRSGRRRRLAVLMGTSFAVALVAGLGLLVVALSGAASGEVPGFPDRDRHADAPGVAPAATPSPTTRPAGPADPGSGAEPPPASSTTTATPSGTRPGNGRNPTHTPPRPPKPTKTR